MSKQDKIKNINAMIFQVCREFGWTISEVENLCIKTVFIDISEDFLKYPPLHIMITSYLGYDKNKTKHKIEEQVNKNNKQVIVKSINDIPAYMRDGLSESNKNQKVSIDDEIMRILDAQESGVTGYIPVDLKKISNRGQ